MKNNLILFICALPTIFLLLYFFTDINIFNKKPDPAPICDSKKQSKFILDCIKEDKTKTVGAITDCEQISIKLFCK